MTARYITETDGWLTGLRIAICIGLGFFKLEPSLLLDFAIFCYRCRYVRSRLWAGSGLGSIISRCPVKEPALCTLIYSVCGSIQIEKSILNVLNLKMPVASSGLVHHQFLVDPLWGIGREIISLHCPDLYHVQQWRPWPKILLPTPVVVSPLCVPMSLSVVLTLSSPLVRVVRGILPFSIRNTWPSHILRLGLYDLINSTFKCTELRELMSEEAYKQDKKKLQPFENELTRNMSTWTPSRNDFKTLMREIL